MSYCSIVIRDRHGNLFVCPAVQASAWMDDLHNYFVPIDNDNEDGIRMEGDSHLSNKGGPLARLDKNRTVRLDRHDPY